MPGYITKIIVVCMAGFLAACGFQPLYGKRNQLSGAALDLKAIKVLPVTGSDERDNQQLFIALEKAFNPAEGGAPKQQYTLEVNLRRSVGGIAVQQNREVTRYQVTFVATYTLVDISTNTVIGKNNLKRASSYDAVDSEYGTYISQTDAGRRALRELAEDFKLEITSVLLQPKAIDEDAGEKAKETIKMETDFNHLRIPE